jgi:5-formyltetrahydrofolate cyclo-ligase
VPDFSDRPASPGTGQRRAAKAAIRAERLAARRSMPLDVRAEADTRVQTALKSLVQSALESPVQSSPSQPGLIAGHAIAGHAVTRSVTAGYAPMPGEPGGLDLPDALHSALGPLGTLLLPVLLPDLDLDWATYTSPTGLNAVRGRPREPAGDRLGPDAITRAGLVVVPAVAVDRDGVRLGRGGGSYDRALARAAPDAFVVALLYDGDLVDSLPAEEHDRRVNAVVTPSGGVCRTPGS